MVNLNRITSNWSYQEREKINQNWELLEGSLGQTASQFNQVRNIANQAGQKADTATNTANNAKTIAEGIDGKATNALATSTVAETKSDNAISTANTAKATSETVKGQFNQIVAESGSNNPEVVAGRTDSITGETFVNLPQRLDEQHKRVTEHLAQNVASEEGVHGIRYFKEELEVRNENEDWVIIPTGAANNVYFYNRGNEFPTVTGGWEVGWSPGDGNLTKYPTYLEVVTNKSGSARQYVTVNSIDLTDFGKLYIEWEGIGLGAHALDVVSSPEIIPGIASLTIMNESFTKTVSVLDISAVNGSYIIAVTQAANYDNIGSLKVYNVWGELK